jgi:hypothetical protein
VFCADLAAAIAASLAQATGAHEAEAAREKAAEQKVYVLATSMYCLCQQ